MDKINFKGIISGILTSVIIEVVLTFITALVFYLSDIPEKAMVYVMYVLLFISVFSGGFLLSKNTDTRKGISGILMALGVFLILFFLNLAFGDGLRASVLINLLVCIIASMLGIITAN